MTLPIYYPVYWLYTNVKLTPFYTKYNKSNDVEVCLIKMFQT